jgi:hypothetical protein
MKSRYQEWLNHVFDHDVEVQKPQWYFGEDVPSFEASASEIAELLGQTFRNAGKDLIKFTDEQVDQGIWYLAGTSGSDFMSALAASEVPLPKRLEAIGNIYHLYSDCFAKRCTEVLAHLSDEGSSLNSSCYMFWDICRFSGLEDMLEGKETQDAVLKVLEKTLTIEHKACREGALHGLGHIFCSCPERVHEIIDGFLNKTNLDDKLLTYARNARAGKVL